ncbi:MAG: hypothetical protein IT186_07120 [Acidobacteria bacterium]|nr:hypothetical protein [Acidobacteriota bacterium]
MPDAIRHSLLAEIALLSLRVCDPACGSGHFLIAAAHRIARRVARVRTGDEEPTPEALQHAVRDVVGRCLYGVDINAMALELAKVALWMEAIEPGKPLGFLDAHFQCGNALLGTTPDLIAGGLPDGAFTALTGDDKKFVSALKKRNKQEREGGQQEFLTASGSAIPVEVFEDLAKGAQALFEVKADSLVDVQRIAANYEEFRQSPAFRRARFVADLWCAAFVWPKVPPETAAQRMENGEQRMDHSPLAPRHSPGEAPHSPLTTHHSPSGEAAYAEPPTHDLIQRCAQHVEPWKQLSDAQRDMLDRLTGQFRFIQWHVLFADVFRPTPDGDKVEGGFDCMLGNPPWERVKLQEKEFVAQRAPEIANAANAAARKRAIERLSATDPGLLAEFGEAQRQAEGESHLMRSSGVYPLCGRGDINVYTIFAELGRLRLSARGLTGVVLPSGIATDDTTKFYFQDVINTHSLVSLFDLENRLGLFPAVDSRMKFCLFTCGSGRGVPAGRKPGQAADFVFFAHAVEDIRDPERRFSLTAEDIKTLNPNTMTCPVFRTRKDAELTKAIYRRVPVLIREKTSDQPEENPWGLRFMAMFHMANDSGLFHTREQLEGMGYVLEGNIFVRENDRMLPLYEAKLFHQFDHRFATYTESLDTRDVEAEEKSEADYTIIPRYWVSESEVLEKLEKRDKGVEREREREREREQLLHRTARNHARHGLPDDHRSGRTSQRLRRHNEHPQIREWLVAMRDLTNATNERTMITDVIPAMPVGHTAPLYILDGASSATSSEGPTSAPSSPMSSRGVR